MLHTHLEQFWKRSEVPIQIKTEKEYLDALLHTIRATELVRVDGAIISEIYMTARDILLSKIYTKITYRKRYGKVTEDLYN